MKLMSLRRSTRVPQRSTRLRDYTTYKVRYPIQNYISYDNITCEYKKLLNFHFQGIRAYNISRRLGRKFLNFHILELLKETSKLGCKPASTPIDSKNKLNTEDDMPLEDISKFQRLEGKLNYLTVTRPNISCFISQIS
jgi:hypothetical protein